MGHISQSIPKSLLFETLRSRLHISWFLSISSPYKILFFAFVMYIYSRVNNCLLDEVLRGGWSRERALPLLTESSWMKKKDSGCRKLYIFPYAFDLNEYKACSSSFFILHFLANFYPSEYFSSYTLPAYFLHAILFHFITLLPSLYSPPTRIRKRVGLMHAKSI